jgi:hypothetical protein
MTKTLLTLTVALMVLMLAVGCDRPADEAPATEAFAAAAPASEPEPAASAVVPETEAPSPEAAADEVAELEWDSLIPADWRPDKLMADYDAEALSDDDPRAKVLMDKLKALWDQAPVVQELDGRRVRLPGFLVPLEMDAETIGEFLLVPYYGACIHVPPPPANQTVYVQTAEGNAYRGELFDTVWVTGTLKVEHQSNELAEAGYQIQDARVEPYE